MKWSEISIHTTNEAVEPISNILHEAGASGVVIEDRTDLFKEREDRFGEIYQLNPDDYPEEGVVLMKAYLPVNSFLAETVDEIKEAIKYMVKDLRFVEEYRGKQIPAGKKSIMLSLKIGNDDSTMTSKQIEKKMNGIIKVLDKKCGAQLR